MPQQDLRADHGDRSALGVQSLPAGARAPRGRRRFDRRGSVLLLVVGVLALLSILSVVYVTVGRTDRVTASSLVRERRLDDQRQAVADYIARIIAEDVVTPSTERYVDDSGDPLMTVRVGETWDAPTSTTAARSAAPLDPGNPLDPAAPPEVRFNPVGEGTDPWLASTAPTWLRYDDTVARRGGGDDFRLYLNEVDWAQISNIAPDGRFVNLATIRGNFAAESGLGLDPDNRPRTSWGLTLFSPLNRSSDVDGRVQLIGAPPGAVPNLDNDTPADPRVPSHWSTRQVNAFRPIRDLDRQANAPGRGELTTAGADGIGVPEYLLNQWADADGDGMADARWQELVDAFDFDDDQTLPPRSLIPSNDGLRYFVAARIVDLSGRVNVNTAGDYAAPLETGDPSLPIGLTPGEVDLRRLLTFADDHLMLDIAGTDPGVYALYAQTDAQVAGPDNYTTDFAAPGFTPESALSSGLSAYTALRRAIEDRTLIDGDVLTTDPLNPMPRVGKASRWATARFGDRPAYGGSEYEVASSPLGFANMGELLAYDGANDPSVLSPLEALLDGRFSASPGVVDNPARRLGPLRSNRPLAMERDGRGDFYPDDDQTAPHNAGDGLADDHALLQAATDRRRLLTTISGARPLVSAPLIVSDAPVDRSISTQPRLTVPQSVESLSPADVPRVFKAVADALLPYSGAKVGDQLGWTVEGTAPDRARTLSYGHRGPELPLWLSAFISVNLKDAYDTDDEPTTYTLLVDDSYNDDDSELEAAPGWSGGPFPTTFPGTIGSGTAEWWPWEAGRRLDLGDAEAATGFPGEYRPNRERRLARTTAPTPNPRSDAPNPPLTGGTGRPLAAPAVNVVGVEAQPFLVQVAAFLAYTDHPDNDPVTDPDAFTITGPGGVQTFGKVSIEGRIPEGFPDNPDFLFSVFAFQVYNPFPEAITLNESYYFQFGDSFYRMKTSAGTLEPGEYRVFYHANPGRVAADARIRGGQPVCAGQPFIGQSFNNWLEVQLGIDDLDAQELERCPIIAVAGAGGGPYTTPLPADVINNPFEDASPLTNDLELKRTALLWRDADQDGANPAILVDRLRDPDTTGVGTVDRRLRLPRIDDVDNAVGGTDSPNKCVGDDTGFTITMFGGFRRPADRASGAVPVGAVPAFCIERRFVSAGRRTMNEAFFNDGDPTDLRRKHFVVTFADPTITGRLTRPEWMAAQASGDIRAALIPTLRTNPGSWGSPGAPVGPIPANIAGGTYGGSLPHIETFLPNDEFTRGGVKTVRPADLLLVWPFGSWQIPGVAGTGPGGTPRDPWAAEVRITTPSELPWTTLSEALALVTDYEEPTGSVNNLFFRSTPAWRAGNEVFVNGRLRLDRYAPFIDENGNGVFDARGGTGASEYVVHPGVPLALALVDHLRTMDAGGIDEPIAGLVNINTAPLPVLRSLPYLSPPDTSNTALVPAGDWELGAAHDQSSDIAATLLAYRDQQEVFPRVGTAPGVAAEGSGIDFRPDNGVATPGVNGAGRRLRTGVLGLRQAEPVTDPELAALDNSANGFRSRGEILLARDASQPNDFVHNIDRLGFDGDNLGEPSAGSFVRGLDTTQYESGTIFRPNGIVDDYQERLAIANAALASTSIRSDVFAAWFILRGYAPEDVEGLRRDDPMLPSVERRFLMVVDRSNITGANQRPRILLFQEVPM